MHESYFAANRNKSDCYATYLISSMIYWLNCLFSDITMAALYYVGLYTDILSVRSTSVSYSGPDPVPIVNYVSL